MKYMVCNFILVWGLNYDLYKRIDVNRGIDVGKKIVVGKEIEVGKVI